MFDGLSLGPFALHDDSWRAGEGGVGRAVSTEPQPVSVWPAKGPNTTLQAASDGSITLSFQIFALRSRSELTTTEIEDALIANAANIGLMRTPNRG